MTGVQTCALPIYYVKECEALWNEEYHVHETPISFKAERVELPKMMVPDEIKDNLVVFSFCAIFLIPFLRYNILIFSGVPDP